MLQKNSIQRTQKYTQIRQPGHGPKLFRRIGENATSPNPGVRVFSALYGSFFGDVSVLGVPQEEHDDTLPVGHVSGDVQGGAEVLGGFVQVEDRVS